ncbi:MAG: DUF4838 domain-containing protein [Armatimonadota bacterium]
MRTAIALLTIALLATCAGAQEIGNFEHTPLDRDITLATGGVAQAVIVVPEGAPNPVVFAGEELKTHLDAMTDADFAIVSEAPADGAAIILGDCPAAREAGIDVDAIARDGYVVRVRGERIFILGPDDHSEKSAVLFDARTPFPREASRYEMQNELGPARWDFERGTLYGAYRFLEELGCRWFMPGEHGQVIPDAPDLVFNAVELREEPVYALRKVGRDTWQWYMLDSDRLTNMVQREEYEELGYDGRALRLWLLRMRGSSEWFAFNHRPPRMDLEGRFGNEHPEYFALRENGKRDLPPQPGRTGHLCYTEPGVLELTKNDIDAYYAGVPGEEIGLSDHRVRLSTHNNGWPEAAIYGRTISLLPHDSFIACTCDDCAPYVHEDRGPAGRNTELVWQFVEKTADWLEEAHPDRLITCLAYSSYSERPPNLQTLPENVIVGMCPAGYQRTHNQVAEENYRELMRMVNEWSGVNDRKMLIWLHHLYRHRAQRRVGVPMLLMNHAERLFRDLSEHANLMHIEMDADSLMLEHLNQYAFLKLLYNPNLDAEEMLEDYAESFYGPGAEIALSILRDIEARSMEVAREEPGPVEVWESHFTEEAVQSYREQADALVEATEGTRHADAAEIFSRWFVGAIERGRELYVRDIKEVAESDAGQVSIRALVGEITVDGKLDEEGWERSARVRFANNQTGEPTEYPTDLRLLRAPDALYFGFTCHDPNAAELPTSEGESDSVEIFLDPQHDADSYYWWWIDIAGRTLDWRFPGGDEPKDEEWESGAEVATSIEDDRWIVEVRIPRENLEDGMTRPVGRPWGANFARSMQNPPRPEDQFSCWSPLIRGRFHQPELFGHIFFVK